MATTGLRRLSFGGGRHQSVDEFGCYFTGRTEKEHDPADIFGHICRNYLADALFSLFFRTKYENKTIDYSRSLLFRAFVSVPPGLTSVKIVRIGLARGRPYPFARRRSLLPRRRRPVSVFHYSRRSARIMPPPPTTSLINGAVGKSRLDRTQAITLFRRATSTAYTCLSRRYYFSANERSIC